MPNVGACGALNHQVWIPLACYAGVGDDTMAKANAGRLILPTL
jgi:hypothetical protein